MEVENTPPRYGTTSAKKPGMNRVKPPTTDQIANMLYLLRDFSAIAILWYRVPDMNGKTRVITIDRTSILNNDGMVACGFLG